MALVAEVGIALVLRDRHQERDHVHPPPHPARRGAADAGVVFGEIFGVGQGLEARRADAVPAHHCLSLGAILFVVFAGAREVAGFLFGLFLLRSHAIELRSLELRLDHCDESTPRDPSRAGEEAIVADADPRAGTGYVTESYVVEERGPSNCPPRISRCACRGRKGTLLFAQGGRPESTLAEVATRQISQLPAPTMTRMRFHPDRGVLVGSRPRTPNPTIHRATATPAGLGRHEPARPHRGRLERYPNGLNRLGDSRIS